MPLRDLEYQARVLTQFDEYLTELAAQKAKADNPSLADSAAPRPKTLVFRGNGASGSSRVKYLAGAGTV